MEKKSAMDSRTYKDTASCRDTCVKWVKLSILHAEEQKSQKKQQVICYFDWEIFQSMFHSTHGLREVPIKI